LEPFPGRLEAWNLLELWNPEALSGKTLKPGIKRLPMQSWNQENWSVGTVKAQSYATVEHPKNPGFSQPWTLATLAEHPKPEKLYLGTSPPCKPDAWLWILLGL